jgi:hypothetical protein
VEETSHEGESNERPCQAISSSNATCGFPASVRCTICGKWFCEAHAEDEQWHRCAQLPGFD